MGVGQAEAQEAPAKQEPVRAKSALVEEPSDVSAPTTTEPMPVQAPVKPAPAPVAKAEVVKLSGVDLAVAQMEQGRLEEAKKTWAQVMASKPDDIRTRFRYAEFLDRTGETDKAIETMRQVAEQNLIVAAPRYWIAEAYARQGKTREASEVLQQMLKEYPREASEISRRLEALGGSRPAKRDATVESKL